MSNFIFGKGFSLTELLVAMLVLTIGLISIASLQFNLTKSINQSYLHSVALVQASSMLERLRANHSLPSRLIELKQWNIINQRLLPQAEGDFNCTQQNCQVDLKWKDQKISISGTIE